MKFKSVHILYSIYLSFLWITASFPAIKISGVVRDVNTYREISNVNVFIKGSQIGTTTNVRGQYFLNAPYISSELVVVFQHIAYETRSMRLDSLIDNPTIDLQPRIIPLQGVEVVGKSAKRLDIEKDLPQTVSVIEARNFEIRGYVDAGDLLQIDHSVQVDEELSGKKTVSIRGGNPDEVVVLYNGVKLNSTYNNAFDLSLINLEDVERVEIIKGSNTALYGPEAFSGVINIVPKTQQNYTFRGQQRYGTYRSANTGIHVYKKFDRVHGSYSFKRGSSHRKFIDVPADQANLDNQSLHHNANLVYSFSDRPDGSPASSLSAMYLYSALDYDNQRDVESLSNFNHMLSLKFSGDVRTLRGFDLSVSQRQLEEDQYLASGTGALYRSIKDRALYLHAEKRFTIAQNDLLVAYQYQHSQLDFINDRRNFEEQSLGLESAQLQRHHHGLVSIAKIHGNTGSDFFQTIDLDMSLRYDQVHDTESNPTLRSENIGIGNGVGLMNDSSYEEAMFKMGVNLLGFRKDLAFNGYLNFGMNTKFPTLFQQISSPATLGSAAFQPNLNPEKNRSSEIGIVISRDIRGMTNIYGWKISAVYFQNFYDNKFRLFSTPGIPVTFYDNVATAKISGIENKSSLFLFQKKVTLELGISRYFISEKLAFPFKSDYKHTLNCIVEHAGYSFQIHWFKEGEQAAWMRGRSGVSFIELLLPGYSNVDLHLSKKFDIREMQLFVNISGRNILDDDTVLQGLAIRDRRYYLTVGVQY